MMPRAKLENNFHILLNLHGCRAHQSDFIFTLGGGRALRWIKTSPNEVRASHVHSLEMTKLGENSRLG